MNTFITTLETRAPGGNPHKHNICNTYHICIRFELCCKHVLIQQKWRKVWWCETKRDMLFSLFNSDLVFCDLLLLNKLNYAFAYRFSVSALMCSVIKTKSPSLVHTHKKNEWTHHKKTCTYAHAHTTHRYKWGVGRRHTRTQAQKRQRPYWSLVKGKSILIAGAVTRWLTKLWHHV